MTDREPAIQDGTSAAISLRHQDGTSVIQTGITAHVSSSGGTIVDKNGATIVLAAVDVKQPPVAAVEQQPSFVGGLGTEAIAAVAAVSGIALIALGLALTKSKSGGGSKKFQLRYVGTDNMLRTQGPWVLNEAGITVGREARIRVRSEKASGLHACFAIKQGNACVEHLSQTNSTLVNNQQISGSYTLKVGDRIQIAKGGDDVFIVESAQ